MSRKTRSVNWVVEQTEKLWGGVSKKRIFVGILFLGKLAFVAISISKHLQRGDDEDETTDVGPFEHEAFAMVPLEEADPSGQRDLVEYFKLLVDRWPGIPELLDWTRDRVSFLSDSAAAFDRETVLRHFSAAKKRPLEEGGERARRLIRELEDNPEILAQLLGLLKDLSESKLLFDPETVAELSEQLGYPWENPNGKGGKDE